MQLYYIEIGHDSVLDSFSISPGIVPLYHCTLCNLYT